MVRKSANYLRSSISVVLFNIPSWKKHKAIFCLQISFTIYLELLSAAIDLMCDVAVLPGKNQPT